MLIRLKQRQHAIVRVRARPKDPLQQRPFWMCSSQLKLKHLSIWVKLQDTQWNG